MDEYTWHCAWSSTHGPSARGYDLLKDLKLDTDCNGRRALGGLEFTDGQYPGSFDRWVDAQDALSVSLLQARIRELKVPIEIRRASSNDGPPAMGVNHYRKNKGPGT